MKPQVVFRYCRASTLMLALSLLAANADADVVVVVSARSSITSLSAEQTARIFLGKSDTLPNGGHAVPVDQAEGNAIRDEFYAKVVGKNSSQLNAYWAKEIFTGSSHPPKLLEGNLTVRKAVANNPNAIGYIDKSALDSSVRIILEP